MSKRVLCLFDVDGTLTEPRKARAGPAVQLLRLLRAGAAVRSWCVLCASPCCACWIAVYLSIFCVQVIEPNMVEEIRRLRGLVTVGTVGGSDLAKQIEQLGQSGEELTVACHCP